MQVGILGPLVVRGPDGPREIAGARLRRLLVRLAVDPARVVGAADLVDAVWSADAPADPTNALQTLISRLRRALGAAELVQQVHGGYRLAVSPEDVDAVGFSRAARRGRDELAASGGSDPADAGRTLREALALWRGEALEDAQGAEYAVPVAARLEEERLEALAARVEADLLAAERDHVHSVADLVAELEDLTRAYPLREGFTAQLMRALAASGRAAEALTAYQRLRTTLADALGTDPSPALQELHTTLLRSGAVGAPRARVRRGGVLRAGLNSFLGREAEQSQLKTLLATSRLSTVVGPGGAGKTRLATEVARLWQQQGHRPVWMVELAPVSDPANVLPAFLGALDLREARILDRPPEMRRGADEFELLVTALDDAPALLLVDNCEHLIDATARLVEQLLVACPDLRVLATSREPLALDGESLCVLPPLGLPPWEVTVEDAPGYAAVRLFLERAAAARPGFRLEPESLPAVVEIVRRLDGLPLAIELAAARLRTLPVLEVASRLSDRFRLLTGGRRTALPRHQTLRAVVEWSWDLLTDGERLLAERLAVFPAGATVHSAAAICRDDALPAHDIPRLLDTLVDKSLLAVADGPGLRYRMLETIREFGVDRLAERGEAEAARERHARWFADLVDEVSYQLHDERQLQAAAQLDAERENILAALRFLGDSGDASSALHMAIGLSWYWTILDNNSDAYRWLTFALEVPGDTDPAERALARATALIAGAMSEPAEVVEIADVPTRLAEASDALERIAAQGKLPPAAIVIRSWVAFFCGDAGRVDEILAKGLADENPWVRAAVRMFRANMAENVGDVDRMRSESEIALAQFDALGDRWGHASVLSVRAQVQTLDGDLRGAIDSLTLAAHLMGQLKARNDEAQAVMRIANLHMRLGEFDLARRRIESSSLAHLRGFGPLLHETMVAALALAEHDAQAMRRSRERLEAFAAIGTAPLQMQGHVSALVLAVLALLQAAEDDSEAALDSLRKAYPIAVETHDLPIVASYGVAAATVVEHLGRPEESAALLGAAARVRGAEDPTDPVIRALLAQLVAQLGKHGFDTAYATGRDLTQPEAITRLDPVRLGDGMPTVPGARTPRADLPSTRASTEGWPRPGHRSSGPGRYSPGR